MTEKRFYVDKSGDFRDNQTGVTIIDFGYNFNGMECREILELMNNLNDENEQLKDILKQITRQTDTEIGKKYTRYAITTVIDAEKYQTIRGILHE